MGRLAIPYLSRGGVTTIRFRCMQSHNCKEAGCIKYLGLEGHDPRLYNVAALYEDIDRVVITEGEIDAMTVLEAGYPAVGYQGTGNWEPYFALLFKGRDVVVIADGDRTDPNTGQRAGPRMAKEIARQVNGYVLQCPEGQDANSLGVQWIRENIK